MLRTLHRGPACCLLGLCAVLLVAGPGDALAAAVAATVQGQEGEAYAIAGDGAQRALSAGDPVFERDRIQTGADSNLTLVFADQTTLALGAATVIMLDSFHYAPDDVAPVAGDAVPREEGLRASIVGGALRALTGLLAKRKPRSFFFTTSIATIGIRGTHFVAEVAGDSATVILLPQEDPQAPNAIEVSNQYGQVEVDKPDWGTEIPDAHSPPSPPRPMRTTSSMNRIVRSANTLRRVIVPRTPMRSPMH